MFDLWTESTLLLIVIIGAGSRSYIIIVTFEDIINPIVRLGMCRLGGLRNRPVFASDGRFLSGHFDSDLVTSCVTHLTGDSRGKD